MCVNALACSQDRAEYCTTEPQGEQRGRYATIHIVKQYYETVLAINQLNTDNI